MTDDTDSQGPSRPEAYGIHVRSVNASLSDPGWTLRRAWLKKDLQLVVRLLGELAPHYDYSSRALASALKMTPRHLQRIFAVAVGRTPQAWLSERRLHAARQLLLTARTVKEVAYALGFGSASQLSRDFKSQFGVVPSTLLCEPPAVDRALVVRSCEPS
ncbi:MAG TPA: helix-turn-helix transcriptional regulator [Polyangiaceae bacterium]|nr:helix-turn-helix transcriptional regulator [Polyangiaceae bacterium]